MDETSQIAIITTVITLAANAIIFVIAKVLARKKDKADLENVESQTNKTESEVINNLIEGLNKVTKLYEEQRNLFSDLAAENHRLSVEVRSLKSSYENLLLKNRELSDDNVRMSESIRLMKEENISLKDLFVAEQIKKGKLETGIEKLIEQMKDAGLDDEPAFTP